MLIVDYVFEKLVLLSLLLLLCFSASWKKSVILLRVLFPVLGGPMGCSGLSRCVSQSLNHWP